MLRVGHYSDLHLMHFLRGKSLLQRLAHRIPHRLRLHSETRHHPGGHKGLQHQIFRMRSGPILGSRSNPSDFPQVGNFTVAAACDQKVHRVQ
jgi:hypothetical protein